MAFDIQAAKKAGYSDQEIQNYMQQSQQKAGWLNNALQLGGGIAGGLVGGIGGAAAGALVPGADLSGVPEAVGGYAGAVGGSGVGSGAGNAAADWIRQNLLGDKTVNPNATVPNSIEAAKEGALGQAIGGPLAKGAGIIAHPIASVMSGDVPFIKGVDQTLASSGKKIDIGQLLGDYKQNVLPAMQKQGLSTDALQAANKLGVDMTNATSAYKATPGLMDTSGLDMNLPIQDANQLARNVQGGVSNFYGQTTQNADIAARKAFGGLLKDAIHTAEPATQLPDSIAHALYKGPDIANGLLQILSFGQPQAARALSMLSRVPNAVTNTVIPKGGGYLNKALPAFLQTLLQANQGQQSSQGL